MAVSGGCFRVLRWWSGDIFDIIECVARLIPENADTDCAATSFLL